MSSLLKGAKTYVDGQWVGAASGETFEVKNPATGEVLASVPNMNAGDTNIAIEAARKVTKKRGLISNSQEIANWGKVFSKSKWYVTLHWEIVARIQFLSI